MTKIIEIVDTDYYSNSNSHVVLEDGVSIKDEYAVYRKLHYTEQRTPIFVDGIEHGYTCDFGAWLIHHGKAHPPSEDEFDTFQEE
jgi:hypothetical protein